MPIRWGENTDDRRLKSMRGTGQRVWIQRIVRALGERRGWAARRERGDTPAASSADALVSPSAEGLVIVFEGDQASVSPAREGFAACPP
jgi:hypothetical protein